MLMVSSDLFSIKPVLNSSARLQACSAKDANFGHLRGRAVCAKRHITFNNPTEHLHLGDPPLILCGHLSTYHLYS